MKRHRPGTWKQSGIALIALLVLLVLAGGYAFYRSTNVGTSRIQESGKLLLQLAQAKEALIAYAVIDTKRPGRLLCPDLIGNGISPLLARDDCDAYGGWLPWKTLDLTNASDGYGGNFRYYLSPLFGGDRTSPPLNSDTATSLRLDLSAGSPSNDIAAIIIATRGALDTRNADADDYFYNGSSDLPDDNDLIIAVTRQELMAAVEQRIANELRKCLEQHASSPSNPAQTYPWPAPLANTIFKGTAKSLFGMIPATQPGSNPDQSLKKSSSDLKTLKNTLESASTAAAQVTAIQQVSDATAYARLLYDRLYVVAADLEAKATTAKNNFGALDATNPAAIGAALPSLAALRESLANSGLDPFLIELQAQNLILKTNIDDAAFAALQTQANVSFKKNLFTHSSTPNPDISNALGAGLVAATAAATDAKNAKDSPADSTLASLAIASATTLYNANLLLYNMIQASRINIDGNEISFRAERILAALSELAQNPDTPSASTLVPVLEASRTLATTLSTASSSIISARSAALSALEVALTAARAASDSALIQSTALNSATRLSALAVAMTNNGDNVTQETLKAAADALAVAGLSTPATWVKDIDYWAGVTKAHAADIARLARKSTWAAGDSTNSAYTAARKLLASLDGDSGTASLLEKYAKTGTEADRQSAQAALAKTQTLLTTLLDKAGILESLLETGLADAATPTVWYGSACSMLNPPTGSDSWWVANGWANLFFYQISDRIRPTTGRLTVNGSGNYRSVVLAAGKAVCQPDPIDTSKCKLDAASKPIYWDRSIRETERFLERKNQDVSRNGEAKSPVTQFSSEAVSATFNDRLSY